LRGRLAIEFHNRPDAAGLYRKYAAFRVGDRILPQHMQVSEDGVVKRDSGRATGAHVAEELDHVRANPHRDQLL
jgi:hypothetical protein